MLTPEAEARLRDKMCIELLEATSSDTALQRYRLEVKLGYPAYDEVDRRYAGLQPRDEIARCAVCGETYVVGQRPTKRFCSERCKNRMTARAAWQRTLARRVAS